MATGMTPRRPRTTTRSAQTDPIEVLLVQDRVLQEEIERLAIMPGGRWIVITGNDGSDGWAKTTVLRLPALE